jgi:alkanesulfonate monooxygenase SsuD/methylene tetrahydromethanopterin reductase-like flavin-dependent oxidoreductase (luciferase family)
MWTNDPADIAESYQRIAARHGDRFLLGIGIGHPESTTAYRQPYATMVHYLDQLDAGGVPSDPRILAAVGPRALRLATDRTHGTHPYLSPQRPLDGLIPYHLGPSSWPPCSTTTGARVPMHEGKADKGPAD